MLLNSTARDDLPQFSTVTGPGTPNSHPRLSAESAIGGTGPVGSHHGTEDGGVHASQLEHDVSRLPNERVRVTANSCHRMSVVHSI
jgi:hypothetical protein